VGGRLKGGRVRGRKGEREVRGRKRCNCDLNILDCFLGRCHMSYTDIEIEGFNRYVIDAYIPSMLILLNSSKHTYTHTHTYTYIPSILILLNSSKHAQAPQAARPLNRRIV
jgi:hypothetical protein